MMELRALIIGIVLAALMLLVVIPALVERRQRRRRDLVERQVDRILRNIERNESRRR